MKLARLEVSFDGMPEGSIIQDATVCGSYLHGLWCSQYGTYRVSLPISFCEVFDASEFNSTPEFGDIGRDHS